MTDREQFGKANPQKIHCPRRETMFRLDFESDRQKEHALDVKTYRYQEMKQTDMNR